MVELLLRSSNNSPSGKQMDKHQGARSTARTPLFLTPWSSLSPSKLDALQPLPDQRITAARTGDEQGKANGSGWQKRQGHFLLSSAG